MNNWLLGDTGEKATTWRGLFVTILAGGVSVVGTSFALYGTSQDFFIIATSRAMLDLLPGSFVASIIWSFGDYSMALSLVVFGSFLAVVTGSISYLGFLLGASSLDGYRLAGGFAGSLLCIAIATSLLGSSVVSVIVPAVAGAAATVAVLGRGAFSSTETPADARRSLLQTIAAIGGYNIITHAVGLFQGQGTPTPTFDDDGTQEEPIQTALERAAEQSLDVSGMTGLVSETADFYKVDINPRPPAVDVDDWSLTLTGAVGAEQTFDYEDIRNRETVQRFKTLRCLGDPIDGKQIGTALWTGTPLVDLIEETEPEGNHLMFRAADGYYYSMPMEMVENGLLAYGMNGEVLPRAHGFPLRALVPNRWGKLNVKWLEEIEIVDEFESGYWEERGWNGMEPVHTVVKIRATNRLSNGAIQMGGHAYAGTRGIQEVEISTDGGESWETATLSEPLPDDDTWRQWKYEWQPGQSRYNIVARATDGTGTRQTRVRSDPYPSGATGWTELELEVQL